MGYSGTVEIVAAGKKQVRGIGEPPAAASTSPIAAQAAISHENSITAHEMIPEESQQVERLVELGFLGLS